MAVTVRHLLLRFASAYYPELGQAASANSANYPLPTLERRCFALDRRIVVTDSPAIDYQLPLLTQILYESHKSKLPENFVALLVKACLGCSDQMAEMLGNIPSAQTLDILQSLQRADLPSSDLDPCLLALLSRKWTDPKSHSDRVFTSCMAATAKWRAETTLSLILTPEYLLAGNAARAAKLLSNDTLFSHTLLYPYIL